MGKFEPGKALPLPDLIAWIGDDEVGNEKQPANKFARSFLMKADGNEETEARYRAHTEDEIMELSNTQLDELAKQIARFSKSMSAGELNQKDKDLDEATGKHAPVEGDATDSAEDTVDIQAKKAFGKKPTKPAGQSTETPVKAHVAQEDSAAPDATSEAIKALKAAIPGPSPSEDDEATEDELIAGMQSHLNEFQRLQAQHAKCYGSKKFETLKPATAEELDVDVKPEPDKENDTSAHTAELELSDDEVKAFRKSVAEKCRKELDETESKEE